jgi:hypothetical protein
VEAKILWLCTTALIGANLSAQELPSVDHVISHEGSAKSAQAARKKPVLVLKGQCESSNSEESGPFEIWISSPRVAMSLNDGDLRTGFDGKQLWRIQRGQPVLKLPAGPLTEAIAILDPARRLRWKELYPKIAVVRQQRLGGRTAFVLETEAGGSATGRFYIDSRDGNLIRAEVMPGLAFDTPHFTNDAFRWDLL